MKIDWELNKDSTDSISIISFIEENDFIIREIFNDLIKSISDNVFCGVRLGGMGIAIGVSVGQELADKAL